MADSAAAVADPGTGTDGAPGGAGGASSGGNGDWRTNLPDTLTAEHNGQMVKLREHPVIAQFKDIPAAMKSLVESQKLLGKSVVMPGEKATPEEWQKFYSKMGRPESPDKYDIKRPDNSAWDENLEKRFRQKAFEQGFSSRQVQAMVDFHNESNALTLTELGLTAEKSEATLKQEWGEKFDRNMTVATRALESMESPELVKLLDSTGLGNHPVIIKMLHQVGELLLEDEGIDGDMAAGQGLTVEDAKKKIEEIRNNPKHPYNDPTASKEARAQAVKEVQMYYKILNPEA